MTAVLASYDELEEKWVGKTKEMVSGFDNTEAKKISISKFFRTILPHFKRIKNALKLEKLEFIIDFEMGSDGFSFSGVLESNTRESIFIRTFLKKIKVLRRIHDFKEIKINKITLNF